MAGRIIVKPGMMGIDPDDLTASAGDVLKGKIAGVAGNDEPLTGTLTLTGNIGAADIRKGKKGYSTDPVSYTHLKKKLVELDKRSGYTLRLT